VRVILLLSKIAPGEEVRKTYFLEKVYFSTFLVTKWKSPLLKDSVVKE
jgi:hypothetical protein